MYCIIGIHALNSAVPAIESKRNLFLKECTAHCTCIGSQASSNRCGLWGCVHATIGLLAVVASITNSLW